MSTLGARKHKRRQDRRRATDPGYIQTCTAMEAHAYICRGSAAPAPHHGWCCCFSSSSSSPSSLLLSQRLPISLAPRIKKEAAMSSPAPLTTAPPSTTRVRQIVAPLTTVYFPNWMCSVCSFEGTDNKPNYFTEYVENCTMFRAERLCRSVEPVQCFPHVTSLSDIAGTGYFYSPGLHCPDSWKTVATVTAGQAGNASSTRISGVWMDTLLPGETAAVCCPATLSYVPVEGIDGFYMCSRNVTTSTTYFSCENKTGTTVLEKKVTNLGSDVAYTYLQRGTHVTTLPFKSIRLEARSIQLNWRAQDRESASSSPASTTVSRGADPTNSVPQTGTPTSDSDSAPPPPPTLSQAAVAGIAAGGAIFVIGVGLLIFALWFRRRKKRKAGDGSRDEKPPLTPGLGDGGFHKAELPSTGLDAGRDRFHKPELEAPNRFEMEAQDGARLFELYGDEEFIPGELPAGGGGGGGGGGPVMSPRSGPPQAQTPPPLPRSSRGGPRPARPGSNNKTNTNASTSANTGHARDPAAAAATPAATAVAKPTLVPVHRKAVPARGTALRAHPPEDPGPARHRGGGDNNNSKAVVNPGRAPRRVRGGSGPVHDRGSIEGGWI
ncbi:hypothetical protein PCL_01602 [Purpureocillium lilacinum]|uniref:Uncharacterized protein n=1 Tax=Purpureocillium lilacinum TaxID=33203 RepID=A0A2U3E1Y1_PURLI|nr:hypothetical protein PCL_01602 [Purpureocillium lilacinum]